MIYDQASQLTTSIFVQVWTDPRESLQRKVEEIKKSREHILPGTVAYYIIGSKIHPGKIEILLIWRSTVMPDEAEREQALDEFRRALDDVLDWSTAQYDNGQMLMHA